MKVLHGIAARGPELLAYLQPFNLDRLAVFPRSLKRCEGLVVAGYSFRDKGVNTLLIDWLWSRRKHPQLGTK